MRTGGGGGSVCGRVGRQSALRWISGDTPLPLNCYSNHAKHTSSFFLNSDITLTFRDMGPVSIKCDTRELGLCCVELHEMREMFEMPSVALILCCDPGKEKISCWSQ